MQGIAPANVLSIFVGRFQLLQKHELKGDEDDKKQLNFNSPSKILFNGLFCQQLPSIIYRRERKWAYHVSVADSKSCSHCIEHIILDHFIMKNIKIKQMNSALAFYVRILIAKQNLHFLLEMSFALIKSLSATDTTQTLHYMDRSRTLLLAIAELLEFLYQSLNHLITDRRKERKIIKI